VKSKVAGFTLTQEASEKELEGDVRNCMGVDFTEALWQYYKRYKHCMTITSNHI
jgi:hypothetical protein